MNLAPDQPQIKVHCPKCKNPELERIPRGRIVKTILPWVRVKHYRCMRCYNKFYKFQ